MHRISIIGLGKSGEAAAVLAASDGFSVFVSDAADNLDIRKCAERLSQRGIFVETGENSERILDSDIIVVSPGVPLSLEILKRAKNAEIPIISEIEFAYRHEQGKVIAITGSNGKSTTATLTAKLFENGGFKTFLAGNIGNPYSAVVTKTSPTSVTVLELSSFQLEAMDSFHPYIAMLLNLSPDHLDRYDTAEDYYRAKFHLFDNQNSDDYAVLWAEQKEVFSLAAQIVSKPLLFSSIRNVQIGADVLDDNIYRNGEEILPTVELGIPGPHNLNNALAAVATTIPFDIPAESIAKTLREFHGIEHRLERFLEHNGITYVNDSKATNPDSLKYALLSFDEPIVLIAGGYDKGADFSELKNLFAKKVKAVVFTGDTGEKMAMEIDGAVNFCTVIRDFEKSVRRAISLALPGDVVMLSPGCASYDAFKNFEHRGIFFKQLVKKIVFGKENTDAADETAMLSAK